MTLRKIRETILDVVKQTKQGKANLLSDKIERIYV